MDTWTHNRSLLLLNLLLLLLVPSLNSIDTSESESCNFFEGSWVEDDSYPLYEDCKFIDAGLNCQKNGRSDELYLKYKWQPTNCDLQRFDGEAFLRKFRGKKIMFVGDSLGSNQWQSLACILLSTAPNSNYTVSRKVNRSDLSFSDYEMDVIFLKNGFLVDLVDEEVGRVLKLDSLNRSKQWEGVDILIFNSYHWWIHTGRLKTWDYFQVGEKLYHEMDRMDAYRIALTTWANWVDSNVDPSNTTVFFQGITAVHYNGSEWDEPSVQDCKRQRKPIEGSSFPGRRYAGEAVIKEVLGNMTNTVYLLDITLLTQLRKDGHPSIYAGVGVDCSHWCVPGVPDAWNQILYSLLI
ncbi:unnamed protein product [Cuscuta epithymum]|uniref:Trichome birefringence-like N-terminal domain-containing protein n=1 Tax=Cuscuta epithymum TaxID=186058 RepID=A0AAV0G6M5_9ASTE|nr:unnamed protein product [Cuscuta epithymum]